ncbi:HEPN domain-containing protein [Elizabethkingia anophelis]|uniref:HEPN domain-containing protein n=1 Tax=Elizabethkingia anophelis TaxID=1117645 RepID=UPI00084074C2|nr:HEPN domain-containing protein [Elizabethkingia anophelis]OCW74131.1 hypothetical protein A4G24_03180 [Elizabethkingia anophelis]
MSDITEDKISYWKDLWENLISDFLKKSYGLNLYNLHLLIEDIILEIEENNNSEIRKYLKSKFDDYYANDIVLNKYFQSDFKLLRTILHTNKNNLILEVSKHLERKFKQGAYFNGNIDELKNILLDNSVINKEFIYKINILTQNLIIEFIKKGYALKDIKKFSAQILDSYQITSHDNKDMLITQFPHNVSLSKHTINGVLDSEKRNAEIISIIDNISNNDRIDKLKSFFYKEPEDVHYIFVVEGLKGNINLSLSNVTFYSPEKLRFATEDPTSVENMQKESRNKFIQASVKVKYLSPESSLASALTTLKKVTDLLHCFYNTKSKIEINPSLYIIIQNGHILHKSWTVNEEIMKFRYSLDINRYKENIEELNNYSYIFNEESRTTSKLSNAIHWYSKAENSSRQEDKILNYWIAIENLFNSEYEVLKDDLLEKNTSKLGLIQLIISSNQIPSFVYDYGWEAYDHYTDIARNKYSFNQIELSDELIEKANLITGDEETISLEKFINSLQEIKENEKNQFWSERLTSLIAFYKNSSETIKKVEEQTKLIEEDILMIYRFRNLIVHNAHFDNALLPYYIWKIREYSGNLIRGLLHLHKNDKSNLSSHLINIYLTREKLLTDLKINKANLFPEKTI